MTLPAARSALLETLGLSPESKAVVVHQDDVGMCHGANVAFATLAGRGFVTSGSVMVPCPWFSEIAELAGENPGWDLGVHLTLTSEWRHYRWRPLTGSSRQSGLVDEDGFMWRTAAAVCEHADPVAVEDELRAQIDTALAAGIDATHLDCHMGTALAPEFADTYIQLGRDYGLPVLFPRDWGGYGCGLNLGSPDPEAHAARLKALDGEGHMVADRFIETPWVPSTGHRAAYEDVIRSIGSGVTFLAFHPNASGDIEVIDPVRAHCRIDELALFQEPTFVRQAIANGLTLIGCREIRAAATSTGA